VPGSDTKIDVTNANSICGQAIETLDGMRRDGPKGAEVRALRQDMIGSPRVQDERAVIGTSNENPRGSRRNGREFNRSRDGNAVRVSVHRGSERSTKHEIGIERVATSGRTVRVRR
jgi:hypothetical protein